MTEKISAVNTMPVNGIALALEKAVLLVEDGWP
jgi:hypothetical protein